GHAFVREALDRGAAGVVVEHPCPDAGRLQVVVPDAVAAHARICHALAGDPSRQLLTVGVTGTFCRTVTGLLVRSILEAAGWRTGLIGALGFFNGSTTRALGAGQDLRAPAGGGRRPLGRPATRAQGDPGLSGSRPAMGRVECDRSPGVFTPGAAGL